MDEILACARCTQSGAPNEKKERERVYHTKSIRGDKSDYERECSWISGSLHSRRSSVLRSRIFKYGEVFVEKHPPSTCIIIAREGRETAKNTRAISTPTNTSAHIPSRRPFWSLLGHSGTLRKGL